MLTKDRLIPTRKIYFKPEITHCPHCRSKLRRTHTAWHKNIACLDGVIEAWSMAYGCPNESCEYCGVTYKSAEAEGLSMKHTSYGFDVLCRVGELRFKYHMTRAEIAEELTRIGVPTSERYAQSLYERYQALLTASLTDHIQSVLAEVTQQNGGIILAMDGVQPEKGNETLYVIREVFSGTVLAARNMKSGLAAELKTLIQPVIDLGFPIVGIVSDGQSSIRVAMNDLLPDVPYQYCQYHYLKDIAKPVVDLDRKLKTSVKKSLRGLRDIERKIEQQPSSESEVAAGYVAAIRAVLLEDGNPPLELPGMRVYEHAAAIKQSLSACIKQKKGSNA